MKLIIPPLSQRDDRWKLKRMGGGGTIGSYGCYLTDLSMFLIYCGHPDMTPDNLNQIFIDKKVYDGNYINFYAVGQIFPDFKAVEMYNCYTESCDLSKVDVLLNKKLPVIAGIGAPADNPQNLKYDGTIDHFVFIIGKSDDGHYIINDPYEGETYYFDAKYGDPAKYIFGLRIYEGTPKETTNPEDKISDLTDKLESCNTALAEKALEANHLRTELDIQEKDNEDIVGQLGEARIERDKVIGEKKSLEIQNEILTGKVQSLEKENDTIQKGIETCEVEKKALKNDLVASQAGNFNNISLFDFLKLKYFTKGGDK